MTDNKTEETNHVTMMRLEFEDVKKPVIRDAKKSGFEFVSYGEKNDYPNYLLDLFDKSGKHGAIIQGKADYVVGNGIAFVDENVDDKTKALINRANNDGETLTEVSKKVALDIEIFDGAFLEIIYARKGGKVSEVYHKDFSNMRVSKDLTKFFYSEDWVIESGGILIENTRPKITEIPAFDPENPKGKQILFISNYRPGKKVYPTPNYVAALRYIQIDICIGEYHLNGITNGMFASKLINFNNGVPKEDDQKKIEKKVNGKFAGAKNAGKIMLSFNKSGENAPTILDLSGTELDKHFNLLEKTTETQIFSSHRVTSPALFGIKSEGLFANNTELRQAFELFQNTYINGRRQLLEKYLNAILSINSVPKVYLQRSEPIGIQISDATIADNLTEDEIRESLGKKPRAQSVKNGKGLMKVLNSLSPIVANKVMAKLTDNEIRSMANLPALPGGDALPTGDGEPATFIVAKPAKDNKQKFSDEEDERDASIFAKYGEEKTDFDIIESRKSTYENDFQFYKAYFADVTELTAKQKAVIDLLTKDPKITPEALADALGMRKDAVNNLLQGLEKDGLINVKTDASGDDETITRTPTSDAGDIINKGGKPETTSIQVRYSYEGVKDDRNRPFCAKMLSLNRMYSREDIEKISTELGYSVWHRRGGWYRPAGSTEARPYCRHFWETHTVIKKP